MNCNLMFADLNFGFKAVVISLRMKRIDRNDSVAETVIYMIYETIYVCND